ncbi:RnfABCDGE type electron transport complex subunit D [Desulfonema magnum]|uniref:Ion-translocating oxidoreductase complex, subunit D n=1 Tax=Desulfonema magnum TaxID=45655 RepID=A0A975GRR0_9BACT|nr:RnfABCDGE type electron transport complex subunit D [Desulfonema magnum]QTA91182.1 Ion-translocating oxidoreductase complex, subunit D [Desulfonema magnum]
MLNQKKFIVSHAPFWHNGSGVFERSYHTIFAVLPAVILGIIHYGVAALGMVCLAVSSAILWELAFNRVTKQPVTIGDGNAAMIGIIFAMLMPATAPWWAVITGTFIAVVIGKHIFGGIGGNPFNAPTVAIAILMLSWKGIFDFDEMLVNYELDFAMIYPLTAVKNFGVSAIDVFSTGDLLMGKQLGGIGSTFGLGLILGGLYLIIRGFIRWEISLSFIVGVFITALLFNASDPAKYAGPMFHLLTGYTLIGAFFLATEDSPSPVNFIPMILYGFLGGMMTVLIRNIGVYADGVIFAILVINLLSPLLDKIRPKALGSGK